MKGPDINYVIVYYLGEVKYTLYCTEKTLYNIYGPAGFTVLERLDAGGAHQPLPSARSHLYSWFL